MALAGEVLALWDADEYGTTDGLLDAAGPALGGEGRAELGRLLEAAARLAAPRSQAGRCRGLAQARPSLMPRARPS